jgi:uncharacterized membrane-anchored protein
MAAALAATVATFAAAGESAAMYGISVLIVAALIGGLRLYVADDEDALEQQWLRRALGSLRPPTEDADSDAADDLYLA